jgi:hypothetical protein
MFTRLVAALRARARHPAAANASGLPDGSLFVSAQANAGNPRAEGILPAGIAQAQEYFVTSDLKHAASGAAVAWPKQRILDDRSEARFLASVESGGAWFGISKILLTTLISRGQHALLTGVPPEITDALRLTWGTGVVVV